MAAIVIGALMIFADLGTVPEGAQFSGPPRYTVRQFKFPSKAQPFNGGNQGAWSLAWTEGDGPAGHATASASYSVA